MRATAPCLLLLPLVLLAGCGGGSKDATTSAPSAPAASDATAVGTPSAQTSVAPVPSASASPAVVAKPTGAVKKFATVHHDVSASLQFAALQRVRGMICRPRRHREIG